MNTSDPYEALLRRGRTNLLVMSVVILGSEVVVALTKFALRGRRFFSVLVTVVLVATMLGAKCRGTWLAWRLVILSLGIQFIVSLVVAYRNLQIPAWARLWSGSRKHIWRTDS